MRASVLSIDRAITILDSAFSFESNRTGIEVTPCNSDQVIINPQIAGIAPFKMNAFPFSTLYHTIIWELMLRVPGAIQHNNSIRCGKSNICVRNMSDMRVYFPPDMVLHSPELKTKGMNHNYFTIDPLKLNRENLRALYNWVTFLCGYTFSQNEEDYKEPVTTLDKGTIYVAFHNGYMGLISYTKDSERPGWRFWENGFYVLLDDLSGYHIYRLDPRLEGISIQTVAGKAGIKLFVRARSEESRRQAAKLPKPEATTEATAEAPAEEPSEAVAEPSIPEVGEADENPSTGDQISG